MPRKTTYVDVRLTLYEAEMVQAFMARTPIEADVPVKEQEALARFTNKVHAAVEIVQAEELERLAAAEERGTVAAPPLRRARPEIELPAPICKYGYTARQVADIMGPRMQEFGRWMHGQTMSLCEAREYNYTTKQYEPNGCKEPHGSIVYESDVRHFLAGGRPLD
jgi:hypothetical protein